MTSNSDDDFKLNDTWILWYHDPNDVNWEIKSYKQLICDLRP